MEDKTSRTDYRSITECRVCRSKSLEELIFMGNQALANSLKEKESIRDLVFPLTLIHCDDCGLVQIRETVKKEILFDHYVWVTQTSFAAKSFALEFCKMIETKYHLQSGDLIAEVASNDGTFLNEFQKKGYEIIGIDPAKNVASLASSHGVRTLNRYWNLDTAQMVKQEYGPVSVLIARNVIAHVEELHDVILGMKESLKDDGVGAIEFHYAGAILDGLQYDSIYHEHLCYFSLRSFERLLRTFALLPFDVEKSPISGGARIVFFSKGDRQPTQSYLEATQLEDSSQINSRQRWKEFAGKCVEHRRLTHEIFEKQKGKKVVGFGASARSSTFLNFCGLSSHQFIAIADNNPLKHGKYTAGSSIPILPVKEVLALKPDTVFILAWNFRDEIMDECRAQGFEQGFIVPFPDKPAVVTRNIGGNV